MELPSAEARALARIAELELENAELRKTVKKGRDVAKALAERYAEKLAEQREAHEAALARAHDAAQDTQQPMASALALVGKLAQLEASVEAYVVFCGERERMLNATVADLSRALRRRDRLLEHCERHEELLDERLLRLEGRVRGVVYGARDWNAKEKRMVERVKEESLLVAHLAQREQAALDQARRLSERLEGVQRAALDRTDEAERLRRQLDEAHADVAVLRNHYGVKGGAGVDADGAVSALAVPPKRKSHHTRMASYSGSRSSTPGLDAPPAMLPRSSSSRVAAAASVDQSTTSPRSLVAAFARNSTSQALSPRSTAVFADGDVITSSAQESAVTPPPEDVHASPMPSRHRHHHQRQKSGSYASGSSLATSSPADAAAVARDAAKADKARRRKSVRSSATHAAAGPDELSAQTLAEVEAEIASLLGGGK